MAALTFLSMCSGIEAASVAWGPLDWRPVGFSEIDPFACHVLHAHYGVGRPWHMPRPGDADLSTSEGILEADVRRNAIKTVSTLPLVTAPGALANWGDMSRFEEWPDVADLDVLCGGTPCQSFSIAGLRGGLDDARGNLMLTFGRVAARYRPRWLVWENVPGVLSSDDGRDFASFLGLITGRSVPVPEKGWRNSGIIPGIADAYGVAWRVFDAQYFGVAQRRRRVFVVGYLGDWRRAAAVLFERHGLCGHPAPSRKARQEAAAGTAAGAGGDGSGLEVDGGAAGPGVGGRRGRQPVCGTGSREPGVAAAATGPGVFDLAGTLNAGMARRSAEDPERGLLVPQAFGGNNQSGALEVASALRAKGGTGHGDFESETFLLQPRLDVWTGDGLVADPISAHEGDTYTHEGRSNFRMHNCVSQPVPPAYSTKQHNTTNRQAGKVYEEYTTGLDAKSPPPAVFRQSYVMRVRRLMPVECELLQAFPPGYTEVAYRGKLALDGPRYKALGNSWCVTNARWIGERINRVEALFAN